MDYDEMLASASAAAVAPVDASTHPQHAPCTTPGPPAALGAAAVDAT